MPLFLISRTNGTSHLKSPAGLHGALVDAVSAPAAMTAANALAAAGTSGVPKMDAPFSGYVATQVAATAKGGFVPALVQGDVLGAAYSGPARGA